MPPPRILPEKPQLNRHFEYLDPTGYLISVLWDSKEQSEAFMQNTLVPALPVDGGFAGPPEERVAQVAHHDTI